METLYEKAYESIRMDQCEEAFRKGYEKAQKDILKAIKESTNGHML